MITAENQNLESALKDRMKENYVISLVSHSRFHIRMAVEANMEETRGDRTLASPFLQDRLKPSEVV